VYKHRVIRIREGTDADAAGVIRVIGGIFDEYPGCVLDVEREEPQLRAPAAAYDRFWVVESDGEVAGCIACDFEGDYVELKKMYLDASVRGRGLATKLVALVEDHARALGISRIELWSDTRFETAHAVYEHLGYERRPDTRELHDLSKTVEFGFVKSL